MPSTNGRVSMHYIFMQASVHINLLRLFKKARSARSNGS